jgi:hypothetical protein
MLLVFHAALILGILFLAGLATSFAEYKFQYSLYQTVAGLFKKL